MNTDSNVVPIKPSDETDTKLSKIYEPTNARELASLRLQHDRRQKAKPVPRIKVERREGKGMIAIDHPNGAAGYTLLMEAMGTSDPDFLGGILKNIANIATPGKEIDEAACNFVLSVITGLGPRDQIEAMLGAQMAAVHMATMTAARRLDHVETLPQLETNEKAFNKLARTFASQVEALKRYRSKGEQRVYVERVNVSQGGQAIVGNLGGREG